MGYDSIDNIIMDPTFPFKECVAKCLNIVSKTPINNNDG